MEVWEQSSTVDPEVRAYVYSLVNAVGGQSTLDDRYAIGDDALAVLNDLLRWLRLYDEKTNRFDVKRCLAEASLVKGDLLEMLALWPEDARDNKLKAKLALACLQLLVPLTWPIELEEDKTTVNHLRHTPYLKLAQVGYKRAILHHEHAKILRTAIRVGLPSMAVERRERTRRDEGIIKMVLYFLRNMAMIVQPQELPSQGDENDISRSATIEAFHEQDVFSLLLTVGSGAGDEFQEQDVIILETLFHLLKGVDPNKLFMQQSHLATEETTELQNLIRKEKAMLNSYNKHAPTRHNRFGTMLWVKRDDSKMSTVSGQNVITDESNTLMQMDKSKKWNKPKYRGKLVHEFSETSDFGMRVDLTENARQYLRTFVADFLDSCFNPLFASLRKAIERETERAGKENVKQYFYLISWFLTAEASRRDAVRSSSGWNADRPSNTPVGENTYAYIAAVLDQETFVLLNRRMQQAFDEKQWQELQATLQCFTQILVTVQSMADSPDDEDQEIAENIQNRIFYEESTQERIVQVLRGYTNQGLAYLDAVTECVHVFVRMLERYSKQNVDLQIRSKRRARKKKRQEEQVIQGDTGEADQNQDNAFEEAEDTAEAYRAVSERKFDFARFSAKFLTQPCVNTFIALLHFYADLSPNQLKRCHRYFYRLAFKNELAVLLFRVDILALLHRLIKGPNGLDPADEGFKDWQQLIQQVFRRCVKWVEREQEGEGWKEAAVVEMMFSKIPQTVFYLQNGFERVIEKRLPRPPAELEIKRGVEEGKRVGVVVCVLLEQGKQDAVEWVKRELRSAVDERRSWEDRRQAVDEDLTNRSSIEGQSEQGALEAAESSKPAAPTIFVTPDTEERKSALFKDKYLRLLLTTAGLQRLGTAEDVEASWIIPSELGAGQLKEVLERIEKTEFDPPTFDDGMTAQDLIRNKSAYRREADLSESESGSDRDINESAFPPNLREKRKIDGDEERPKKKRRLTRRNRTELTEAEAQAKAEERKKKEWERNSKIKSQLYVTASDDESDEEADAEFYRLEEERRRKMKGIIKSALLKEAESKGSKTTRKHGEGNMSSKKQQQYNVDSDDAEGEMDENEDFGFANRDLDSSVDDNSPAALEPHLGDITDGEISDEDERTDEELDGKFTGRQEVSEDEDTPSTSPTALDKDRDSFPLNEVSSNAAGLNKHAVKIDVVDVEEDDEDVDEAPIVKPTARRSVRAGFIIESDSE